MAINRRLAIIIVVGVLAVAGTSLLTAWISPLQADVLRMTDLNITHVQFDKDCITIKVKNQATHELIIREVRLNNYVATEQGFIVDWTSTPHTVPIYEPISVGEQISIHVNFNWVSGHTYQISLKTASTTYWTPAGIIVEVAP